MELPVAFPLASILHTQLTPAIVVRGCIAIVPYSWSRIYVRPPPLVSGFLFIDVKQELSIC